MARRNTSDQATLVPARGGGGRAIAEAPQMTTHSVMAAATVRAAKKSAIKIEPKAAATGKVAGARPASAADAYGADLAKRLAESEARVRDLEQRLAGVKDRIAWISDRLHGLLNGEA